MPEGDGADVDPGASFDGDATGKRHGFFVRSAFDDVEATEYLLGLRERAVGSEDVAVVGADRLGVLGGDEASAAFEDAALAEFSLERLVLLEKVGAVEGDGRVVVDEEDVLRGAPPFRWCGALAPLTIATDGGGVNRQEMLPSTEFAFTTRAPLRV